MRNALWIALVLVGCASHPERGTPQRISARRVVLRSTGQRPVELSAEAFRAALFATATTSGLSAVPVFRTSPPMRLRLVSAAAEEDLARTSRYLDWCRWGERGGGDCAGVLDEAGVFGGDARAGFALHVALSGALREAGRALGSIRPEQVRAALSVALLVSTALVVSPDPVSKLLAVGLACNLIAFLGVELFNHVVRGYLAMRKAALAARTFDELLAIGDWYAGKLGPVIARVAVMLATFGVAKAGSMMPVAPTGLPGSAIAAANTRAAGLPMGNVTGVAVAADGVVTVTVAGTAAMAIVPGDGRPESAPPEEEPSAEKLDHHMRAAGVNRAPGTAAHHIVAGRAGPAEKARQILRKFGIGINDANNGVYLPCSSKMPCDERGAIHSRVHTDQYYRAVNDRLAVATTRDEAIKALREIADALRAGRYP